MENHNFEQVNHHVQVPKDFAEFRPKRGCGRYRMFRLIVASTKLCPSIAHQDPLVTI